MARTAKFDALFPPLQLKQKPGWHENRKEDLEEVPVAPVFDAQIGTGDKSLTFASIFDLDGLTAFEQIKKCQHRIAGFSLGSDQTLN